MPNPSGEDKAMQEARELVSKLSAAKQQPSTYDQEEKTSGQDEERLWQPPKGQDGSVITSLNAKLGY